MGIFNHVQIKVKDLKTSRKSYTAVMKALEDSVVLNIKGVVVDYGTSTLDMFEIRQANKMSVYLKRFT